LSAIAQEVRPGGIQRRVLGLAWPVIGENLLETLLGVVDTFLVAGLGAAAIAGVGTALQVMFFLISALSALSVGASVLVAQAYGAGDLEEGCSLARQSIIWSFLLSVPLAACGLLFSRHIVALFGVEPDVAQIATEYLHVSLATVVVLIALFIGGGVLRGVGDSRTPMIVTSIANVINVLLAYGLIYGHMGLPRLGAVGSAWGTFIARSIALVMLLAVLWKGRHGVSFRHGSGWLPSVRVAANVMRIGVPAAMEQVMISAGFFVLSVIVAHLGTDILAAYRITFTALSFSFLPGIGFAIAATTLVGQSVGARRVREGESAARVATLWAMIWMGTIGAVLFLGAEPIMGLFSQDPRGGGHRSQRPEARGPGAALLGDRVRAGGGDQGHRRHLVPHGRQHARHVGHRGHILGARTLHGAQPGGRVALVHGAVTPDRVRPVEVLRPQGEGGRRATLISAGEEVVPA